MFVMVTGIGIIGALASIFASLLVGASSSGSEEQATPVAAPSSAVEYEPTKAGLESSATEIASIRQLLEDQEKTSLALRENWNTSSS